ncbi:MAG: hypothetical protein M9965_01625 [Anaerolineae bacterium]|nr:hypothetical protein [Anaerolineae bacterium]
MENDNLRYPGRLIMPLVVVALLAALWAGLLRLGWRLPPLQPQLAGAHGPLMVVGFLGTLIALERAVALRKTWCLAAPVLIGVGALLLIVGWVTAGAALMVLGSGALVLVSADMVRQHPALHTWTMASGAVALLVGTLLWALGRPIFEASTWWAGFLILVIAGERLELSRVLRLTPRQRALFLIAVGLFGFGLIGSLFDYGSGTRLASVGVIAVALWLIAFDLARRNIRKKGLTRYIAVNLLVGYVWLVVSGVIGVIYTPLIVGPLYDAWLHALFLGFVFGMIFAHAPIILPGVTGFVVEYRPIFYLPPILLNLSLLLRLAGDFAPNQTLRQWGGLLNEVAILVFAMFIVIAILRERSVR